MTEEEESSGIKRSERLRQAIINIQKIDQSKKKTLVKITMDRKDYNFLDEIRPDKMSMQEVVRRVLINSFNN